MTSRLPLVLLLAGTFTAQSISASGPETEEANAQDRHIETSQPSDGEIGSTVKLSPQMRVVETPDPEAEDLKELEELLRQHHRGTINSD